MPPPSPRSRSSSSLTLSLTCSPAQDPAPFGTQFFNDDDDQGGNFDAGGDPDVSLGSIPLMDDLAVDDSENLWAGTQDLKRTRPDYVKYTKRAKRVDVKKLKDSIWKGLDIFAPPIEGEDDDDEVSAFKSACLLSNDF